MKGNKGEQGETSAYRVDKKKLRAVAQKYKLDLIVAFGSQVKGRAIAGRSDLDVAVRLAPDAKRGGRVLSLHSALAQALQADCELDVSILNGAPPLLLYEVAIDGVPLYERTRTTFLRFWSYAMRRYYDNHKFFLLCRQYLRERYA
mgnify:CR=1 FL=1